jgi:hypothetical protein
MILEIIGYIGSALVVVSMLMSSIYRLRIINTIGSIISCIYALLVGAMPLALMNACLIVINLYNLYKLRRTSKPYDMAVCSGGDGLVQYLLDYYKDDIHSIFPDFEANDAKDDTAYVVLCDGNPVGMLMGKQTERYLDISLDYAAPAFRDMSIGSYVYSRLPEYNINRVRFSKRLTDTHRGYLEKMGYKEKDNVWMLTVEH